MRNISSQIILKGKRGKTIEVNYKKENLDFVEFVRKSNRGSIRDTILIPTQAVVELSNIIKILNENYKKGDS